jgi:tRNA nucleotidyltransferase (CCA-adding enzyme)
MRAEQVIATHGNTDFDAYASLHAARLLFPHAVVALPAALNKNVREFAHLYADALPAVEASRLERGAIRRLIVVETVHASRLAELEEVALDPAVEKAVFDHHAAELPDWVPAGEAVISQDGALTTTLVGIVAERELAVSGLEATAFALGIHEDTGSLTYPTATQRDADALAWCFRHGARQDLIAAYLHTPLSARERELLDAMVDALESRTIEGVDVLVTAVAWPAYVDGISNLAHKVVDLTDAQALVALVEMDNRVFCVVRSRTWQLDASAVAQRLGGAGHPQAASAIVRGTLDEARGALASALVEAVVAEPTARDVMVAPPRTVEPEDTVAAAMALCRRFGQSGVFVAVEERLVGTVSREDLDRAIAHGLAHAPVRGIMTSGVVAADADETLAELQRLVARSPDGRVAIERDRAILGVVTRSDVLRALGAAPAGPVEQEASLARELEALERLAPVFEAVAGVGAAYAGVYLVGGTVRDILLGERSFDVDIAVEGDAIAFARSLARVLGGRVRAHTKFGTAVVLYGPGERVDVVTTRTEFYAAPAALPSVEHATLREDLFRRDFTINAMAVSLEAEDFGRLVDPFGGRSDLAARRLRVLHNLSFIEDPTRIFRALRYETRLGFRMDEHTRALAVGCVDMGLVGDLSSARLRDELEALLSEERVDDAILRLSELGLAAAIHPNLAADEEAVELIQKLRELRRTYEVEVPEWRLGLIVLARRLPAEALYAWLERLRVRRRDADQIAAAVTVGPRLVERLRHEAAAPAEVVALAEPFAPDAPLYALALADLEPLRMYFRRLREVRLEVTGADLAALGVPESPRVGEILAELRRRKLNGDLDGRESELAAARELIAAS